MSAAETDKCKARSIGRFSISYKMLQMHLEEVRSVMRGVVVVRAESRWDKDCIDYVALCDAFEPVEGYREPPEYQAVITRHPDGEITAEWQRKPAVGELTY